MKLKRIKKTIKYFLKHYEFKTYQCVHYFLSTIFRQFLRLEFCVVIFSGTCRNVR